MAALVEEDRQRRENGLPGLMSVALQGQLSGHEHQQVMQELMQSRQLPFLTPARRSNGEVLMPGLATWEDMDMSEGEEEEDVDDIGQETISFHHSH
jgi:hypothetical protein